jgi:hypothetical protein
LKVTQVKEMEAWSRPAYCARHNTSKKLLVVFT